MYVPYRLLAQDEKAEAIVWSTAAHLPAIANAKEQIGLAGVFAGLSNHVLLIAGGSNFPGLASWQGGKKVHYSEVYVLKKQAHDKYVCLPSTTHLKNKIAYGASITTADGVICAGGETETANSTRDAFLMKWDAGKNKVIFHDLPLLPIPLANACMTGIGKKVYLMGGESNGKPSARVFMLDLSAQHQQWKSLPDLPVAMSHSVAVTQSNGKYPCVYVMGGRSSTSSGISELHNAAFCYDPAHQKWITLAPISDGRSITTLSAGTGVASGANSIILVGGDKGNIFHQIETYNAEIQKASNNAEKEKLQAEKIDLITHHPGFSRDVLVYNTINNAWHKMGELPFYSHVTSIAVKWDNNIFIPCGEIKPGVRTADIVRGEIKNELK
jgi:N-acetylneuraminate epimerase